MNQRLLQPRLSKKLKPKPKSLPEPTAGTLPCAQERAGAPPAPGCELCTCLPIPWAPSRSVLHQHGLDYGHTLVTGGFTLPSAKRILA